MVAYSDFKIVEASLEAIPQIYFLIVFSLASWLLPKTSYLGLINILPITFSEAAFILLSIAHSFASSITSIISAMDIRKHEQLTFTSKLLLGLSATFQLAGRLWPMVVISMLAVVDTPSLTASQAGLLLILPVVCHWVSITTLFFNHVRCFTPQNHPEKPIPSKPKPIGAKTIYIRWHFSSILMKVFS